jgi:hypothetical protein
MRSGPGERYDFLQRATWLLVYDNAPAPDAVADLLPSAGARVLITSRFSDWSEQVDEVALDVLPLEEAVALLRSRTGRGYAGAQTLAEALGCLPLALDHAAAYCKRTQMRFADYATKVSSLIDAAPRGVGYLRSVAATFPAAEALMAYLAQCAPERIPMTLVEGRRGCSRISWQCFSNMRRLPSSAWSNDSASSEGRPVSSASFRSTRWRAMWAFSSAMCR